MRNLVDEGDQKAKSMGSFASPEEHGYADTNPGDTGTGIPGINFKDFIPGLENRLFVNEGARVVAVIRGGVRVAELRWGLGG